MNAPQANEPVSWRGFAIGATLFFGLSLLLRYYALDYPPPLLLLAGAFALAGGLVGQLGMRNVASVVGPVFGMAIGLFAGAIVGDQVGGLIVINEQGARISGQIMKIAGPTLDGQEFNVKDWQGKVVIVDFWATWCKPCLEELPNLQKAYDRFHEQGLEIVSICLDDNKEKLAAMVKERQIPWPQIIFDEPNSRGWDKNPLARAYNITGIPAVFLLDREGRIAPVEPRGENMMPSIERYLAGTETGNESQTFGTRTDLFPMGLLLGACIGGFVGIRGGNYLQGLMRRKPKAM